MTKMVSLRIDTELLEYLTERAKSEHRTLSNLIASILLDAKENAYVEQNALDRQTVLNALDEIVHAIWKIHVPEQNKILQEQVNALEYLVHKSLIAFSNK